jgi:hypothetical protein
MEVARVCFWLKCGTAGTCHFDAKGDTQRVKPEGKSPDAKYRGGKVRSSDEVLVMRMERRDFVIPFYL